MAFILSAFLGWWLLVAIVVARWLLRELNEAEDELLVRDNEIAALRRKLQQLAAARRKPAAAPHTPNSAVDPLTLPPTPR